MGTILTLLNFIMLLFWVRLWVDARREFYFNPFLSGPVKIVDSLVSSLGLPYKLTCLLVLLFGCVFRAALAFRFGHTWQISLGSVFVFTPHQGSFAQLLSFSLLDFLLFIVRLWTVFFLVKLITPANRHNRAIEAFHFIARPFSQIPGLLNVGVLLMAHLLIMYELRQTAMFRIVDLGAAKANLAALPHISLPAALVNLLHLGWMTAASFVEALNAMRTALIFFIIGGLLASLFQNSSFRQICFEGLNVLLGRFARSPFATGMIDFTPLIFFFVLQLIYAAISSILATMMTVIT